MAVAPPRASPATRPVDYPGMTSPDLDRPRFLLAGLREPPPSPDAERRALEAFRRLWLARGGRSPSQQGRGPVGSGSGPF